MVFGGFVGAMAFPWPMAPTNLPKTIKKAKNCKNPKYGLGSKGFVGPDAVPQSPPRPPTGWLGGAAALTMKA